MDVLIIRIRAHESPQKGNWNVLPQMKLLLLITRGAWVMHTLYAGDIRTLLTNSKSKNMLLTKTAKKMGNEGLCPRRTCRL